MPVPSPMAGENRDKFMARCMRFMSSDTTKRPHDQQIAICMSQFKGGSKIMGNEFTKFVPIEKIDPDQRMVYGWASTPEKDTQGDIIPVEAIKNALPEYLKYPAIREMHQPIAAGKTLYTEVNEKGLYIGAKIVDDGAWKKVKEGIYAGFSIGGSVLDREDDVIKSLELAEISLVDSPANKGARIELYKRSGKKTNQALLIKTNEFIHNLVAVGVNPNELTKLVKEVNIQMADKMNKVDEETVVVGGTPEVETPVTTAETPEVSEAPEAEEVTEEKATEEVAETPAETEGEAEAETVEASAKTEDLQKAISTAVEEAMSKFMPKPKKEVFVKVASFEELKERVSKLENTVISKVKSPAYPVEKGEVRVGGSRLDEINKRLGELEVIKNTNLTSYQTNGYQQEALMLLNEKSSLESK